MNISITHADIYTTPESYSQVTSCVFLGMILSGLEYMKIYAPDGSLITEVKEYSLILIPENFRLDFQFGKQRKNYMILCRLSGMKWNEQTRSVELEWNDQKINIPMTIPVPPVRKEQIQDLFHRIIHFSKTALPAETKVAEMLALSILAEFLEHTSAEQDQKLPEVLIWLKNAIDSDTTFQKSLSELMEGLPVTEIHLRRLFQKYYHTNPAEYRSRLRFAKIQKLLTETDLSFKEIADSVGMNHVTHLYLFLKKHCGMTPAEYRKNLRM